MIPLTYRDDPFFVITLKHIQGKGYRLIFSAIFLITLLLSPGYHSALAVEIAYNHCRVMDRGYFMLMVMFGDDPQNITA